MYNYNELSNLLNLLRTPTFLKKVGILKEGNTFQEGTVSTIKHGSIFAQQTDSMQDVSQDKRTPTEVVISSAKTKQNTIKRDRGIVASRKLFNDKDMSSPFIAKDLFYDDKGNIIQERATNDLFSILDEYQVTPEQIKIILVQLILAVEALHKKNIVHRDIKIENILCFFSAENKKIIGDVRIKLADFDGVVEVDEKGNYDKKKWPIIVYTEKSTPEKLIKLYAQRLSYDYDFRQADLFAIGEVCILFAKNALGVSIRDADRELLFQLGEKLKQENACLMNIKQDPYFGASQEQREALFNQVESRAIKEEKYYDGCYFRVTPCLSDSFMILPADLKAVYAQAEKVFANIQSIDERRDRDDYVPFYEYVTFQKQVNQLMDSIQSTFKYEIDDLLKDVLQKTLACLEIIRAKVEDEMKSDGKNKIVGFVNELIQDYLTQTRFEQQPFSIFKVKVMAVSSHLLNKIKNSDNMQSVLVELEAYVRNAKPGDQHFSLAKLLQLKLYQHENPSSLCEGQAKSLPYRR